MSAKYKAAVGAVGPLAIYRARALAFLGLSPLDPLAFEAFDTFAMNPTPASVAPAGWGASNGGSGTQSSVTAARAGGWRRLSTGATAGSTAELFVSATTLGPLATAKWYFAYRFALVTTPDANSILLNAITNAASNKSIGLGFRGSLNASNFIVQYDGIYTGSSINLGIAVDTASHIIEAYGVGSTTLRARIDGGVELSAVMAAAPADTSLGFDILAQNGATAANQTMDVDWAYMLGQGA